MPCLKSAVPATKAQPAFLDSSTVQVNQAYHQGRTFHASRSQDVWSVAVIALEMLSATPITRQTYRIPLDDHEMLARHFDKLSWWYTNLWMLGLGMAGVDPGDDLTCALVDILQECFQPAAHLRPNAEDLHHRVRILRDEAERRRHASQVCADPGTS
jgi:serine/threonine protein kinase